MCEVKVVLFLCGTLCVCIWLQFWWSEDLEVSTVFCNDNVNRTSVWALAMKPCPCPSTPPIIVSLYTLLLIASAPCSTPSDTSTCANFCFSPSIIHSILPWARVVKNGNRTHRLRAQHGNDVTVIQERMLVCFDCMLRDLCGAEYIQE